MQNKKIIFWGSPLIAKEILEILNENFSIQAVVSQPDRPVGRKKILTPTPVKHFAIEHNIPYFTPEVFDSNFELKLKNFKPDFFIVIAFGKIIPKSFLQIPKIAPLNIHYSLLPKLRGPSPITYSLLNNFKMTGISIIEMNVKMDQGDIIYSENIPISMYDNYLTLEKKLTDLAKRSIIYVINNFSFLYKNKKKQNNKEATYTPILKKDDAIINWFDTNINIFNQIRAYMDWPKAYTFLNNKRIQILDSRISNETQNIFPGTVFKVNKNGIYVVTGDKSIIIKILKPEGKKELNAYDFYCGNNIKIGDIFIFPYLNSLKLEETFIHYFDQITIHHTNSFNYVNGKEEFNFIIEYHKKFRHFDSIGYHFVITQNGEILIGRPLNQEGAHVKGHNKNNLGIALIGDFNIKKPSTKQIYALFYLLKRIKNIKNIPVLGHRDFLPEKIAQCPGDYLYKILRYFND